MRQELQDVATTIAVGAKGLVAPVGRVELSHSSGTGTTSLDQAYGVRA
jgi:hypothetical protein